MCCTSPTNNSERAGPSVDQCWGRHLQYPHSVVNISHNSSLILTCPSPLSCFHGADDRIIEMSFSLPFPYVKIQLHYVKPPTLTKAYTSVQWKCTVRYMPQQTGATLWTHKLQSHGEHHFQKHRSRTAPTHVTIHTIQHKQVMVQFLHTVSCQNMLVMGGHKLHTDLTCCQERGEQRTRLSQPLVGAKQEFTHTNQTIVISLSGCLIMWIMNTISQAHRISIPR